MFKSSRGPNERTNERYMFIENLYFTRTGSSKKQRIEHTYINVNKVGNKSVIFHIVAKRIGRWNNFPRYLLRPCYSVVCIARAILVQIIDPIVGPPGEYVWNKSPLLVPWHRTRIRADVYSWKTVHPSASHLGKAHLWDVHPRGWRQSRRRSTFPVTRIATGYLLVP